MMDRKMKNEQGFTLIELLIAMAIGIILLGASIYTYTRQDSLLRQENRSIQTRDFARMTMDRLADDLILAGSGFPPGNSDAGRPAYGITNADVATLTYRANTDNTTVYVDGNSTVATNKSLKVPATPSTYGFAIDDNVVFFDVQTPTKWNTKTYTTLATPGSFFFMEWGTSVAAQNGNFGAEGGGGDGTFEPIADNVAIPINKYHNITYTYDSGAKTIAVWDDQGNDDGGDDTTITIANNVSAFSFSYFDEDGTAIGGLPLTDAGGNLGADIRKIQISLTIENEIDPDITETLLTDINLRNMGI